MMLYIYVYIHMCICREAFENNAIYEGPVSIHDDHLVCHMHCKSGACFFASHREALNKKDLYSQTATADTQNGASCLKHIPPGNLLHSYGKSLFKIQTGKSPINGPFCSSLCNKLPEGNPHPACINHQVFMWYILYINHIFTS